MDITRIRDLAEKYQKISEFKDRLTLLGEGGSLSAVDSTNTQLEVVSFDDFVTNIKSRIKDICDKDMSLIKNLIREEAAKKEG